MVRTNYRSGIVVASRAGTADATGLLTISFPAFGGNENTMVFAALVSVPGLSAGLDYTSPWFVNPTASFSGPVTWVKIWMSTTSAANASVNVNAAAITGSV